MTHRPASPLLAAVLALLTACNNNNSNAPAAGAATAGASAPGASASAPPVGVTTVRAQQRDVPVAISATGAVTPLASVDVRAQTTSVVDRVHVKEGQFVRAGELLFTLDSRADEAKVAQARAQMSRDEATLADARRQYARAQELLAQNFVSQGAVDTNRAQVEAAQAAVNADRAALEAARVALSYARVTAPSAGRLGQINVYPGSAVQANTTALVSVTQLDPIAVAFNLPQRYLSDALAALKDGGAAVKAVAPETGGAPGGLAPDGGARSGAAGTASATASAPAAAARGVTAGAPPMLQGRLQFVDNAVDPASGTVKVKALFDNRDGRLWPGAFVNVVMTASTLKGAVVVPQAAIIQGPRGTTVYVVQDGKAQARPVEVLYAQGDDAAVSGVKPGERIVLDGRQNLRPGAAVVESGRGGASAPAGAGASAASAASGASAAAAGGGMANARGGVAP